MVYCWVTLMPLEIATVSRSGWCFKYTDTFKQLDTSYGKTGYPFSCCITCYLRKHNQFIFNTAVSTARTAGKK